ncbi:MAG: 2Fe-2S iron-sulfur cluster binding domain-containing protein, partial [Rhodospirillaceae bacterium]|nr:2Fe-2S iron-sulfur cluster binding domain-containing protein [Rhodospirillaceae bacterium]
MPKSPETDTVPESGGALVVFMPTGRRGRFAHGTPLLQAARTLGVDIDSVCGGRGICGRCQVIVGDGDYAKLGIRSAPDHLGALAANELRFDARDGLAKGVRLSCSARLAGDVVIDVPASSQIHRQVIRKRTDARIIEIDPIVRPLYVEFDGPDNDAPGDRLRAALRAQWDITPQIPDAVAAQLLGDEDSVTVALREEAEIVALWPGFRAHLHGLSVDIGSTTVAAQLCHLGSGEILSEAGMMNPQIRFGEDVMSRVSHIMMNPGSGRELTAIIRGALSELARDCAGQAGVSARDIVEMTVVGNPIMHHIFLGLDPTPLGQAPF